MSIRIGILGYGNLGRGVECAIKHNPDMELVGVFTRRAPETVKILTETAKVYSNMTVLRSCFVHICKMFRDSLMGIKAVYHIEPLGIFRCLLWQVSSTSAAKNHNISLTCFVRQ